MLVGLHVWAGICPAYENLFFGNGQTSRWVPLAGGALDRYSLSVARGRCSVGGADDLSEVVLSPRTTQS